jgi:hypothetical protein
LLIALAVYLEHWMSFCNGVDCSLLWSEEVKANATTIKRLKANYLTSLHSVPFADHNFQEMSRSGKTADLGCHIIRKSAATWSKMNGCTMDKIETRGRWKRNSRRVVDRCISVYQPQIEAKVEGVLCVGGPIQYSLVDNSGIKPEWLKSIVVRGKTAKFGQLSTIAQVLGLPLLWACLDSTESRRVPEQLCTRITVAYGLIRVLPPDTNPVKRVLLAVYQINEQLCIEPLITDGIDNTNTTTLTTTQKQQNNQNNINHAGTIPIQLNQQRQKIKLMQQSLNAAISNTGTSLRLHCNSMFSIVNCNISIIALPPPRRPVATPQQRNLTLLIQEHETNQLPAELSKLQRTLLALWEEWTTDLGGRKSAVNFTPTERGAVRFNFSRRKTVWSTINRRI